MRPLLLFLVMLCFFLGCKSPEARPPVTTNSGSFIKESAQRNKKLNKIEREKIQKVIATFPEKDFVASKNGFWFHYNNQVNDEVATAKFGDKLEYTYDVSNLNGQIIYSTEDLGNQVYVMDKEELFSGLREGLKMMKPNENITFIFPSQQAYGYYGDENKIGTNVPLIVNVNLKTITQSND